MEKNEIRQGLKAIIERYEKAEAELSRPAEHVVTLSVCQNSRRAVYDLLCLYLSAKGKPYSDTASIDELFGLCYQINSAFIAVDIANVECKDKDASALPDVYCLDTGSVNCCTIVAGQIKEIFEEELLS